MKNKEKDKKENVELDSTEIEAINTKLKEAEEKILRANADMINYRKRKDEEVTKALKYASEDIILDLLPIVDNFERAIKMDDNILDDEVSKYLSGIKMIYASLISLLDKYNVKEIKALNEKFNPAFHEAVMTQEDKNIKEDIVTEVFQKGYILIDKVIRPAMVKVNKIGGENNE